MIKRLSAFVLLTALFFGGMLVAFSRSEETELIKPLSSSTLGVSIAPTLERILYVSDKDGNKNIYEMDLTTKKTTRITSESGDEMNPQVSPDHMSMVYYADTDGDNDIYEMNLMTKKVVKLTENTNHDYDPSYSPDGKQIVFKSDRDDKKGDIFLMDRNGTNQRNITAGKSATEEWDPVMSPTGEIYYVVRRMNSQLTDELYVLTDENGEERRLTTNAFPDWYPAISDTGELVYISKTKQSGNDDIFLLSLTDFERVQLTSEVGDDADPSWSRDGQSIIYINDKDGDYDLYIMNADGSNKRLLMNTPATELSPVFL